MTGKAQTQSIQIQNLGRDDINRLKSLASAMRHVKEVDYFERNFDYIEAGEREALLVRHEGLDAGYCFLNWHPKYAFFRKMDIPEIQDVSIIPDMRRKGLASAMLQYCEQRAVQENREYLGLGVAVNSSFGPAQILYARHGFIPDGNGVTYDRVPLASGDFKPLDDQLCLMMVKRLK